MQQTKILTEFIDIVRTLRALVIPNKLAPTQDGVTLLEVKIHSILSYLTNLCFAMLLKVDGTPLSLHPVVEQLATLRIIIEKTRPLEIKLKYQIDKLVKAAAVDDDRARVVVPGQTEEDDEEDELMHAPNPKALVNKKEVYKDATAEIMKDAVYRPPRIAPQHFERDRTKLTKTQKKIASESKLLADLKTQYSSQPEVHSSQGTGYGDRDLSNKFDKMLADKEAYEEENFLRPNLTRKDKQLLKKVATQGASMRFQDEFKGVERAVQRQSHVDSGMGLLGRANKSKSTLKRKYTDASEMLSAAKNTNAGKDEFKSKLKSMKKAATKKEKKAEAKK